VQCSDCHQAHKAQDFGAQNYFMDEDLRNAACVSCHVTAAEGPQTLRELAGE
jgi:nitrate/TMAO reductase-like tetraheme cytochrome c subunit